MVQKAKKEEIVFNTICMATINQIKNSIDLLCYCNPIYYIITFTKNPRKGKSNCGKGN